VNCSVEMKDVPVLSGLDHVPCGHKMAHMHPAEVQRCETVEVELSSIDVLKIEYQLMWPWLDVQRVASFFLT
jgi:hypothetical protein